MRLLQGQSWKQDEVFIRIVKLERLAVTYKTMKDPVEGTGEQLETTKKEFCRLIKDAELQD